MAPRQRESLRDEGSVARLHQLGRGNFDIRNRFRLVPSLRIDQPLVPTEVLRAAPSQHGALYSVDGHVRTFPASAIAPAPIPALASLPLRQPPANPPLRFKAPPIRRRLRSHRLLIPPRCIRSDRPTPSVPHFGV